jgi:hypothetical protein
VIECARPMIPLTTLLIIVLLMLTVWMFEEARHY